MDNTLNIIGILLSLFGSILLAFSLSRVILELKYAFEFHDLTIKQFFNGGHIPVFTGVEDRLKKGFDSARFRTAMGLILIAFGFAFQLFSLLVRP